MASQALSACIRKPPLELGPCENQERKGKTRKQKKALSQYLSPPTDIILLLASTSTALPLPAIPVSPSLSCYGGSNPLFILCSPIHLNFTTSTHPTLPATQPSQLHQRLHPSRSHRFIIRCTFQLYRGRVRERHSLELSIDKILPG